jgi:opacity protein-like surface antigen
MTLTSVATFSGAMANDEQYLQSDPIDINGYVKEAPVTDHELETVNNELRKQTTAIKVNKQKAKKYGQLSRSTEKLADATEEMIEERKESQVTIDKFNKKIDCMMAEGQKEGCDEYQKQPVQDEVRVAQAAPVVQTQVEAPSTGENFGEAIKVLPYAGLTTFMTETDNLEAGIAAGIRVETNVNKRFSIGMGFKYTTMKTTDYSNGNIASGYQDYYSAYYGGREIEYSNMNFDIYSKFFIVNNNRFRPYIGAGIGYNRSSMSYTNNNSAGSYQSYNNYQFGNEEVNASHINAELLVGSEVIFSKSIGMNLELAYNKGMGSNLSSESGINSYQAPDQQRLEDLSNDLTEADIVSLNASLLIQFQ